MTLSKSALIALLFTFAATVAGAPTRAADANLTPTQKAQFEAVIRDYIIAHPEIIEEALGALEKKRTEEASVKQSRTITERADLLFDSKRQIVLGNPKGKVTVVEFFDYNCGYCKRALTDMTTLIDQDQDLRFVLKEFPVLGQGSMEAAQVAVAVALVARDKYGEFHKKLLGGRGEANRARALDAAEAVGIERKKVEGELANPEIGATIEESYGLANGLGLTGTPSYVVGKQVIPGAIGLEKLKAQITEARAACGAEKTC